MSFHNDPHLINSIIWSSEATLHVDREINQLTYVFTVQITPYETIKKCLANLGLCLDYNSLFCRNRANIS